jgi:hypothetical protein
LFIDHLSLNIFVLSNLIIPKQVEINENHISQKTFCDISSQSSKTNQLKVNQVKTYNMRMGNVCEKQKKQKENIERKNQNEISQIKVTIM